MLRDAHFCYALNFSSTRYLAPPFFVFHSLPLALSLSMLHALCSYTARLHLNALDCLRNKERTERNKYETLF